MWEFSSIDSTIYAETSVGIGVSLDIGLSWDQDTLLHNVFPVAKNGSLLFGNGDGFYRSFDGGVTWNRMDISVFEAGIASVLVVQNHVFASPVIYDSVNGYVAGHPDVYSSSDNGTTWISTGLFRTAQSLLTDGINIFAGTDSSVYRRPLSDFGISSVAQPPVGNSELQIFPNPLSQSTTISFTPETSGYAGVSIVNPLGVEIAHLFSGELGIGNHSVIWNPVGVAAGMYECLVRMNGHVETLPLILTR